MTRVTPFDVGVRARKSGHSPAPPYPREMQFERLLFVLGWYAARREARRQRSRQRRRGRQAAGG